MLPQSIHVGCSGWAIRTDRQVQFPETGTHLERYAARFNAVEINSSFYRPHRPATYARWSSVVSEHFRFAVKVPKEITHRLRLAKTDSRVQQFLHETAALGEKLGPLLVQLPPSLTFREDIVEQFFTHLRQQHSGAVVCEPRHASWFTPEVEALLSEHRIGRVAADPLVATTSGDPGGWQGIVYYRWHGSPVRYYSSYDDSTLTGLANRARSSSTAREIWCIFDNTAEGAAIDNAFVLQTELTT